MLGLMFIGALILYLLFSGLLAWLGARLARSRGMAGWKVGAPVFVAMLLLVFWDWLPMEVMFKHYCGKYAGFTQYKTLDEWKAENPGGAETLAPIKNPPLVHDGDVDRYVLNQRFAWEMTYTPLYFNIWKREERIVDTETGEVLARYIDFNTDIPSSVRGVKHPEAYKIWMIKRSCEAPELPLKVRFNGYFQSVKLLGSK